MSEQTIANGNENAVTDPVRQQLLDKTLKELIEIVNRICSKCHIEYFAQGDLLTTVLSGKPVCEDQTNFMIGLMRADFERFMKAAAAKKDKLKRLFYDL